MDSERLLDALSQAGLTEYQAGVYLALLELGTAPVVDVAERSNVPTSQVYEVVRTLEDRGFVETMERDRLHARAQEPVNVTAELRGTGELLTGAADEIEDRWERPDPSAHRISVVKRKETVMESLEDATADAQVSVEVGLSVEQFRHLRPTLESAADRDVVVRVAIHGDAGALSLEDTAITEVRQTENYGPLLAVVDRDQTFFSPNVHASETFGVLIGDAILSFIFHWSLLTCAWIPGETVARGVADATVYVSIEEFVRDAAALWHDGATIELTVVGRAPDTGEDVALRGTLAYVVVGNDSPPDRHPSYEALAGTLTVVVEDGGEYYTVGGWGAQDEDVEAEVIHVESVADASSANVPDPNWRD